jgi:glucose-6-phosphate isomerase
VNAYHQPGVEAGKKAAASILTLQRKVLATLSPTPQTASQIATAIGDPDTVESTYFLLEHLSANGRARIVSRGEPGEMTFVNSSDK